MRSISSRCSWSTASMPTLYWSFHCNRAMAHFLCRVRSVKYELAVFGAEIDDEHLVRGERNALAALMVEAVGTRGIAHAHRDVVLTGRQHETLVDARWSVARYAGRTEAGVVNGASVHVELHIDRAAFARAFLRAPHVQRQFRKFFGAPPAAVGAAVRAMHEGQHDDAGAGRRLPVDRTIGKQRNCREQRSDHSQLTGCSDRVHHGGVLPSGTGTGTCTS